MNNQDLVRGNVFRHEGNTYEFLCGVAYPNEIKAYDSEGVLVTLPIHYRKNVELVSVMGKHETQRLREIKDTKKRMQLYQEELNLS